MLKKVTVCLACRMAIVVALAVPASIDAQDRVAPADRAWETIRADFSNVRGLNYIASYAPSDVAILRS